MGKERNDSGPVVNDQPGDNRPENARKESLNFRYFFSMFCGGLVGSLLGTLVFKFFALLFQF